jgi:PAS domain S-box-containing protein
MSTLKKKTNISQMDTLIAGKGEMAELIRTFSWEKTSLGPVSDWPQSLLTSVNIVLQSPVPLVMLWGEDGIMIYNDAYSVFAGQRHPRLLGSKVVEGWPEVADFNRNVMAHGLKGKTLSYKDQQLTLYRNNVPEEVWMDLNYSPIIGENGKPAGVLAIVTETTEQVLSRKKIVESEAYFRMMSDSVPVMMWVTRADGYCTYLNKRWYEYTGQTVEEASGLGWLKATHPDDIKSSEKIFVEAAKKQKSFTLEYRLRAKDGTYRWMLDSGVPKYDENGKFDGHIGSVIDIHERKTAEDSLVKYRDRYQKLFNSSLMGIFIPDFDGVIHEANDVFLKMLGYTKKDLVQGKIRWDKMTPDEYRKTDELKIKELLQTGQASPWEKIYMRKDGTPLPILVGVVVIEESPHIGLAFALDLTEQKRLERQKDDFLGIASHELKTPVTSIKAYAQALETIFRRKGDNRAADQLSKMDTQVDKLSNLINDLLDVTKIQAGRLQFHRTEFKANELVEEIVEEVQRTATNHTIKVKLDQNTVVYGDRDRVGQVLLNFLTNAIKYSPQSEIVEVSSKVLHDSITISVRDYGVGIPQSKQEKVFDQFFRVEGPKHETYPGLGLGLYISKEIIQREKGKIWVKSTEGKGSTFSFSIPLPKNSN